NPVVSLSDLEWKWHVSRPRHARKIAFRFRIQRLQPDVVSLYAYETVGKVLLLLCQCPGLIWDFIAFHNSRARGFGESSAKLSRSRLRSMGLDIPVSFVKRLPKTVQVGITCAFQTGRFVCRCDLRPRKCGMKRSQSGKKNSRFQDFLSHGLTHKNNGMLT